MFLLRPNRSTRHEEDNRNPVDQFIEQNRRRALSQCVPISAHKYMDPVVNCKRFVYLCLWSERQEKPDATTGYKRTSTVAARRTYRIFMGGVYNAKSNLARELHPRSAVSGTQKQSSYRSDVTYRYGVAALGGKYTSPTQTAPTSIRRVYGDTL